MKKINPIFYLVLMITSVVSVYGTNFSVDSYLVKFESYQDSFVSYYPLKIFNDTNDTLYIKWEKSEVEPKPKAWDGTIQDPNPAHFYKDTVISSTFTLEPTKYGVFVLQFYPNNTPGTTKQLVRFTNLKDTTFYIDVMFEYQAKPLANIKNIIEEKEISKYEIYSLDGRLIACGYDKSELNNLAENIQVPCFISLYMDNDRLIFKAIP